MVLKICLEIEIPSTKAVWPNCGRTTWTTWQLSSMIKELICHETNCAVKLNFGGIQRTVDQRQQKDREGTTWQGNHEKKAECQNSQFSVLTTDDGKNLGTWYDLFRIFSFNNPPFYSISARLLGSLPRG